MKIIHLPFELKEVRKGIKWQRKRRGRREEERKSERNTKKRWRWKFRRKVESYSVSGDRRGGDGGGRGIREEKKMTLRGEEDWEKEWE